MLESIIAVDDIAHMFNTHKAPSRSATNQRATCGVADSEAKLFDR
jgi:hypothetical protein